MTYKIKLEKFEGPMDLLYHLIEKNEIDIYDIPISKITDQYLEYIDSMKEFNLDVTSDFILMASTLLEIKSKMLLPKSKVENEETEDPREELVNKLIEYKKYRIASGELKERNEVYKKIYYKLKEDIEIEESELDLEGLDIRALIDSYKNIVLRYEEEKRRESELKREKEEIVERVHSRGISIEESMDIIRERLELKSRLDMLEIFKCIEDINKSKIVSMFIAILELIKRKEIVFFQEDIFGHVIIEKRV